MATTKSSSSASESSRSAASSDAKTASEPKAEQRSSNSASTVIPDVGVYGRVIKNGGAFDQPMTIANLIEDDEDGGTWVNVITNPESNEHLHVRALNRYSEQDARDVSAQRRNIYVSWVDDPQPEPVEPNEV